MFTPAPVLFRQSGILFQRFVKGDRKSLTNPSCLQHLGGISDQFCTNWWKEISSASQNINLISDPFQLYVVLINLTTKE